MNTTDDELAIRNLIARFAEATDVGTMDEYMACVADDAVMVVAGAGIERTGAGEIRSAMEANRANGAFGPGSHTMHVLAPSVVEVDGDRAIASTPFQFFRDTSGTKELVALGRHRESFVRTAAGWRLARRETVTG